MYLNFNILKIWKIKKHKKSNHVDFQAAGGIKVHEKEINVVALSPDNKLIATGSQDKLVLFF